MMKKAAVTLKEYLVDISKDPGKREMLRRYPRYALKDVEISHPPMAMEALASGNWKKVRQLVGGDEDGIIYEQTTVTVDDLIRALAVHDGMRKSFLREPAELLAHVKISEQGRQMLLAKDWARVSQERGGQLLPSVLDEALKASQNSEA